jgi:hypothetical protein
MTSVPVAGIARSKTSRRPEGRATGTRLEMLASEVRAARPSAKASSMPAVEGEAGMPVTVVSLPGRRAAGGRPQGRP